MYTHRSMCVFVIDMHKGAFDVREHLNLVLELLANIMCLP
jgi:hypothetical protein